LGVINVSWFRRNAPAGSWLALMALAFQLVIAAFHVHPGTVARTADQRSAVTMAKGLPDTNPATPAAPHDPICAACVLIQLAASATHSVVPALDLPSSARWLAPATAVPELSPILARRAFNARAPPLLWHLG
jgi:hypothetical protein